MGNIQLDKKEKVALLRKERESQYEQH